MYSRSLGILNEKNANSSIESFNKSIREQYRKKTRVPDEAESEVQETVPEVKPPSPSIIEKAKESLSGFGTDFDFDTLLIVGIILILLTQTEAPDLILLGALASVIF